MKLKPNILMLVVFLAVVLSPYLVAYFNGQEVTSFDWFTMGFLVLFAFAVFVWWRKRKNREKEAILDDMDEEMADSIEDIF